MTKTAARFALRTVDTEIYVFDLQQYTMPAATDDEAKAKTWASARGALAAARRHGLTNVEAVEVVR